MCPGGRGDVPKLSRGVLGACRESCVVRTGDICERRSELGLRCGFINIPGEFLLVSLRTYDYLFSAAVKREKEENIEIFERLHKVDGAMVSPLPGMVAALL